MRPKLVELRIQTLCEVQYAARPSTASVSKFASPSFFLFFFRLPIFCRDSTQHSAAVACALRVPSLYVCGRYLGGTVLRSTYPILAQHAYCFAPHERQKAPPPEGLPHCVQNAPPVVAAVGGDGATSMTVA